MSGPPPPPPPPPPPALSPRSNNFDDDDNDDNDDGRDSDSMDSFGGGMGGGGGGGEETLPPPPPPPAAPNAGNGDAAQGAPVNGDQQDEGTCVFMCAHKKKTWRGASDGCSTRMARRRNHSCGSTGRHRRCVLCLRFGSAFWVCAMGWR